MPANLKFYSVSVKGKSSKHKNIYLCMFIVVELCWLWDIGLLFYKNSSLISTFATTFYRAFIICIAAVFHVLWHWVKSGFRFKSKYLMWIAPICCCVVSRFQAYWEYFLRDSIHASELMLSCWVPLYGSNFSNICVSSYFAKSIKKISHINL